MNVSLRFFQLLDDVLVRIEDWLVSHSHGNIIRKQVVVDEFAKETPYCPELSTPVRIVERGIVVTSWVGLYSTILVTLRQALRRRIARYWLTAMSRSNKLT